MPTAIAYISFRYGLGIFPSGGAEERICVRTLKVPSSFPLYSCLFQENTPIILNVKAMRQIDIDQAKIQLDSLLQAALDGDEVIITQNNQPILKLVRCFQPKKRSQSGSAKGLIWMSPDFDQPLEDFNEYMK